MASVMKLEPAIIKTNDTRPPPFYTREEPSSWQQLRVIDTSFCPKEEFPPKDSAVIAASPRPPE